VLFDRFPQLIQIRDELRYQGAAIAQVSGSGSALFGIFGDQETARRAQQALTNKRDLRVYAGRTLESRPD
jgi:4-diphosphocytidyl-2-C-methyl-D-erythritol kinase